MLADSHYVQFATASTDNGDGAILLVNISIPTGLLLRIMRWVEPVAVLSITVYGRM